MIESFEKQAGISLLDSLHTLEKDLQATPKKTENRAKTKSESVGFLKFTNHKYTVLQITTILNSITKYNDSCQTANTVV